MVGKRLFELHVAMPKMNPQRARKVFSRLKEIGITKNKFFLDIRNVTGNIASGHDFEEPGTMSTMQVKSYRDGVRIIKNAMKIIFEEGLTGIFEIEQLISGKVFDFDRHDIGDFPGFGRVNESPLFENHAVFKGTLELLPSPTHIISLFSGLDGLRTPDQLVDFCADPEASNCVNVSRVATFYQPSREVALEFGRRMLAHKQTIEARRYITEQVCLVGEPRKDPFKILVIEVDNNRTGSEVIGVVGAIGTTELGEFEFKSGGWYTFENSDKLVRVRFNIEMGLMFIKGKTGETVNGIPKILIDALDQATLYCKPRGIWMSFQRALLESRDKIEIVNENRHTDAM